MSLSRRLVLTVLAVSAVGLLTLGLVSYLALRSYLSDRVDDQARDALPLAGLILGSQPPGEPGAPAPPLAPGGDTGTSAGAGSGVAAPTGSGSGSGSGNAETGDAAQPQPGTGFGPTDGDTPPDAIGPQLPTGTYAELRGADGTVIASQTVGDSTAKPDLPDSIDAAPGGPSEPFDADSDSGGSAFRVVAQTSPSGETLIVAIPLDDLDDTLGRLRSIELLVSLAILAAIAALSLWAVRAGLRPLARMEETAGVIAAGDMSARVEDTDARTEVGRLGLAFNEMLARLEQAFAEQRASEERLRRFLADASHELRTPLSSIRGYAELFRMGATAEPAELERAMSRIEGESVRMSSLVEDLLALARLDEVRQVQRERVDFAAILDDACSDARASSPDREVSLTVPAEGEGVLRGDPDALRQLAGNLIANALNHGAGAVEVSLRREGGYLDLGVRDHGPGLPPGSEADVFERFWRAGEARDRPSGGAGLGLAIVAGIAASHAGTATAANASDETGGGALFSVRLPVG